MPPQHPNRPPRSSPPAPPVADQKPKDEPPASEPETPPAVTPAQVEAEAQAMEKVDEGKAAAAESSGAVTAAGAAEEAAAGPSETPKARFQISRPPVVNGHVCGGLQIKEGFGWTDNADQAKACAEMGCTVIDTQATAAEKK